MKISDFSSFNEMYESKKKQSKNNELDKLIGEVLDFSETNEYWIGTILDYLNGLGQEDYIEYHLASDFYGSRKYSYRIISTQNNLPNSITDQDVETLFRLNAQPRFILYDYKVENNFDLFEYYNKQRTLKLCLKSLGMQDDLQRYLCELCFNKIKHHKLEEKILEKKLNN